MMADSLESYIANGVSAVRVDANIDVGGYAWARLGFRASDPEKFLGMIERRLNILIEADKIHPIEAAELLEGAKGAGPDVAAWVAAQPDGKQILLGTEWRGYISFDDDWGRTAAQSIIDKAKAKLGAQ